MGGAGLAEPRSTGVTWPQLFHGDLWSRFAPGPGLRPRGVARWAGGQGSLREALPFPREAPQDGGQLGEGVPMDSPCGAQCPRWASWERRGWLAGRGPEDLYLSTPRVAACACTRCWNPTSPPGVAAGNPGPCTSSLRRTGEGRGAPATGRACVEPTLPPAVPTTWALLRALSCVSMAPPLHPGSGSPARRSSPTRCSITWSWSSSSSTASPSP